MPVSVFITRGVSGLLVFALTITGLVTVGAPASAAEERYAPPPNGVWEVDGRGWGHGIGLSQWGAKGAAEQGRTYGQILDFYYPGTTMDATSNPVLRVGLSAPGLVPTASVEVWNPPGQNLLFLESPGASRDDLGAGWLTVKRSDSEYVVERRRTFDGPVVETVTRAGNQLTITSGDGVVVAKGRRAAEGTWYRGEIRLAASTTAGTFDVVNDVRLEDYLRGVVPRESPASWPIEALKAQAVAARSYVLAEGRRGQNFDTCDTTACQVYGGRATVAWDGRVTWAKESSETDRAIGDTAGQVRMYGGAVAFTQFSSTNGGYSRQGSKPYLVAKPDPYTGTASGDTRTRWTDTLAVSTVQAKCPSGGRLLNLVIVRRDGNGELGGRITEARVECTTGSRTLTSTGDLAFGMFSHWWRPVDQPGTFYLNDTWSGTANIVFQHGMPDDEVYVGDWDGNRIDTVALRHGRMFSVRNTNSAGPAETTFGYGRPDDTVLVGDWDGDGVDTLAVRRGAVYHIKNSVSAGEADVVVAYGRADDEVLVGDWDGDGQDTLTVRRGARYLVRNTMTSGTAEASVVYGRTTDVTLAGDWDGNGIDTLAVRRGAQYFVKNSMRPGEADIVLVYGRPGDEVYAGDWNGDRKDTLGVYRRP